MYRVTTWQTAVHAAVYKATCLVLQCENGATLLITDIMATSQATNVLIWPQCV